MNIYILSPTGNSNSKAPTPQKGPKTPSPEKNDPRHEQDGCGPVYKRMKIGLIVSK